MSNPSIPTADQLAETRTTLWHHGGDPLLTLESLRAWINQAGLVLFTPRAQQLPAPAPSLVEAVLGTPNSAPTLADTEQARVLTARLIAEGSAIPLNLLGTPGTTGDTPDYLCSAAVFSYIFTLRGDKAWRQPPATSGAIKVSPLGLATYELLAARVTMSAADLATELGKEVTEAAVLRGLSELWSYLRVLPIPQQDGSVLWELMSTRFTKQIKAGANAGQPSALSALISLYLGMAVVATEEEIETILSPLAPRSRIRDVVHALTGARQLEAIAVGGRTVLHIAGDLPTYGSAVQGPQEEAIEVDASAERTGEEQSTDPASRITKFIAKPRKTGTGFATRFTPRPGTSRPTTGAPDRERRPFQKKAFDSSAGPSFTKPWDENRPGRPAFRAEGSGESADRPTRSTFRDKPTFRKEGGTRPTFRRDESASPSRDFPPRTDAPRSSSDRSSSDRSSSPRSSSLRSTSEDQRPPRKTFSKPGTFGRKREDSAGRPSFGQSDSRPPRRDFNAPRPAPGSRPAYGNDRQQRTTEDRPSFNSERNRERSSERRPGSYTPRPSSSGEGFAGRKPYAPREAGAAGYPPRKPFSPSGSKPPFYRDRDAAAGPDGPRKVFRKFDAPRFDKSRPPRPEGDRPQGSSSKPGGSFPAKKPFARPGSKPPGTFAKFADGNKPFRKPGPGGKKFSGKPSGATGAYRKRKPEGEA